MILKKLGDEYKLYSHDSCIATTQESPHKRLSKQNCDEMFGIIDVGALALEECNNTDPLRLDSQKYKQDPYFRIGYLKGFNKAMELNKDKLFTLEDMKKAFNGGWVQRHNEEGSHYKNMEILIQSIQQPTEIDVEIVTHVDLAATPTDSRHPDAYLGTDTGIPFLDENGCLILTKKK
jgi:hypothetical protein